MPDAGRDLYSGFIRLHIMIMLVALVSTKLPILLGRDVWIFHGPRYFRWPARSSS